jgi:hypothetical protein
LAQEILRTELYASLSSLSACVEDLPNFPTRSISSGAFWEERTEWVEIHQKYSSKDIFFGASII